MIKSKVIDALRALDKSELKEFESFVDSPFFNKNKNVSKLFGELRVFYPSFSNEELTKEYIYKKILPGKAYNDKTFRNLMSDLLDLFEKFIGYKNFTGEPFFEKYNTVSGLARRRLINLTESRIKELDKMYENLPFDGGNVFYVMHLLEMQKDFLDINKNKMIDLNMKEGEYLIYTFLSKYLIFKMKYLNYLHKSRTEKLSGFIEEFERSMNIDTFMESIEDNASHEAEIILIYYYCTKFMSEPEQDIYYEKVKVLFEKNKHRIDRTEKINIYLTLNTYCIVRIRSDIRKYERELFELYLKMFEENLVLGEGEKNLHITIFYNVFLTALRIGELEWSKSFIEENHIKLLPEYRETMYNFAYAYYYFSKKEYERALVSINKVNFENYYIKAGARILLLKIYFELNYTESFFSLCDTVKHYLASDKQIPEKLKKTDNEFINLANKIYRFRLERDKYNPADLELEVKSSIPGINKEWLLEKLHEA